MGEGIETTTFREEADLMMKLRPHRKKQMPILSDYISANVVHLYGVCFEPLCIVLRLYTNGSLWNFLKSHVDIAMDQKIKFLKDIASGVAHLHREHVVHRDLAARNVLVRYSDCGQI